VSVQLALCSRRERARGDANLEKIDPAKRVPDVGYADAVAER
jgi:hypothetical protein